VTLALKLKYQIAKYLWSKIIYFESSFRYLVLLDILSITAYLLYLPITYAANQNTYWAVKQIYCSHVLGAGLFMSWRLSGIWGLSPFSSPLTGVEKLLPHLQWQG